MKKAFSAAVLFFFLAFSPGVCFADLGSEVSSMFDRLGLSGTATPSGVYEGQSRGFITGGSVSVRLPNETVQPLSVSLPHLRSGCGGVDLFLGAISYISADDLIRKMKTIGTSFASYAFMMALKTLCSPCENIMEKLEAASRAANSLSVNTCRAGESLAEGIFGEGGIIRGEQAGRCAFVGVKQSLFTDPAEGLSECRTQSGITSAVADINAGSVAQDKELVKPVRNTVWEALRTIPSTSLSKEQKEQIMSVTGTFVTTQTTSEYKPPTISLDYLAGGGGAARVYHCGTDPDCTAPAAVPVGAGFKPFSELVSEKLLEAHAAIVNNRRPRDETVKFLDALPFPAWKLLSSAGAVDPEIGGTYVSALARPIAVFSTAAWLERATRNLWSGVGSSERKGILSAMDRKKIAERMRILREEISLMLEQENTKIEKLVYAISIIEHLDSRSPVVFERRTRKKAGDEVIQGAD